MRIMFDARRSVSRVTGIGRLIDGLLASLAEIDRANEYLVLTGERNPLAGGSAPNVAVRPWPDPPGSLMVNVTLPRLAREWRADVTYFPFWLAPLRMPCPSVVAVHDLIHVFFPEELSLARRAFFRVYLGRVVRTAARVHTLAQHGKDVLCERYGLDAGRVDVVPPALAASVRVVDDAPPCGLDQTLTRPFGLYVGNHKPHKNLDRLLRAYARVAADTETDLVIVGALSSQSNPDARPHEALATRLGIANRVRFVGQIDDQRLSALYRDARYLVFPSLYEGFGLPPLEAMACGTPVACSNTTSLPEVVGDAAVQFDPLDERAMAEAIARLDGDADLRRTLSERGRAQAQRYTWDASARAWLASLDRAVSG